MPKKIISFFIFTILLLAFVVRVYNLGNLLGFYFDQGRDALVIWDFVHNGKLFLIGPTTGIAGIFRGPWYYWLITPFYFLGHGNPVFPSVFLALTTVIGIFLLYKLVEQVGGRTAGVIAIVIAGFSYYFVYAARWLSNPTPMFVISMILLSSICLVIDGKKWAWIVVGASIGMAMQFGSAAEVFYAPGILLFVILQRRFLPSVKTGVLSLIALSLAFVPQVIFDIKHGFILSHNIINFLSAEQNFKLPFWEVVKIRLPFYFNTFFVNIFPSDSRLSEIFLMFLILLTFLERKILFKNQKFIAALTLFAAPLIGMLFFQGNSGNVYGYYFTGYYFIFVFLVALILGVSFKKPLGMIVTAIFLILFLKDNLKLINTYFISQSNDPKAITLANQKSTIDWIYKDAGNRDFNVDVYVPPVIPYAYDYLFKWLGTEVYKKIPQDNVVPLLYTVSEADPDHPDRVKAWSDRQKGIATIQKMSIFGPITVEQRTRIK